MGWVLLAAFVVLFPLKAIWRAVAAGREVDRWDGRLSALEEEIERSRARLHELRSSR